MMDMVGKRQFSLGYVFLLVFCWAIALAATRQYWVQFRAGDQFPFLWVLAAGLAWCVAISAALFRLDYGLKLAVRIALPMGAVLLVLGGGLSDKLRDAMLLIALFASGAVVFIADAILEVLKRRRDRAANQE